MLDFKSQVGKASSHFYEEVFPQKILDFRNAIGLKAEDVAPPTFLTVFRKGEFELFKTLGIELSSVLHAEQEYHYDSPIFPGDLIEFQTKMTQVLEKQTFSFRLQFVTFETEFQAERNFKNIRIGKSITTIVIREKRVARKAGRSEKRNMEQRSSEQ